MTSYSAAIRCSALSTSPGLAAAGQSGCASMDPGSGGGRLDAAGAAEAAVAHPKAAASAIDVAKPTMLKIRFLMCSPRTIASSYCFDARARKATHDFNHARQGR
jgi:hypothetical protein